MDICVIVRVYDRIEDLGICINTIRQFWKQHNYYLIVVSNGIQDGFVVPDEIKSKVDKFIDIEENAGHIKGSSQLLTAGLIEIPENCKYTVLLEADTWVFSDKVLSDYVTQCIQSEAVWASAEWLPNYYSLAVDFAIAESKYIKENRDIFSFTVHAESHIYNYLRADDVKFRYIKEHSPVHYPKLLKHFSKLKGRIMFSVKGKMVSHHIEDLPGGMDTKKRIANIVSNQMAFDDVKVKYLGIKYSTLYLFSTMLSLVPKKQWIKKKKIRKL